MSNNEIVEYVNNLIPVNRGITLEEEIRLNTLPKTPRKNLTPAQFVVVSKTRIIKFLGRANITPRDLKKAIIKLA